MSTITTSESTAVTFSADAVRGITDQDTARLYIRKAASEFKAAQTKHGSATVKAAYATDLAVRVGILKVGRGAKVEKEGEETQTQYGARFLNLTGGGAAQTTVGLWVLLGRALVTVGVDEKSDLFRHLAFKGGATKKHVAAAIRGENMDKAGNRDPIDWIETVLRCYIKPDGKTVPAKDRDKALADLGLEVAPDTTVETDDNAGEGAEGGTVPTGTAIDQVRAAMGTLIKCLPDVDQEAFNAIDGRLIADLGRVLGSMTRARARAEKLAAEAEVAMEVAETA